MHDMASARREGRTAALQQVDVGLEAHDELPFLHAQAPRLTPLVISFPHVGLEWPELLVPAPPVNLARNADFEVDAIYPDLETCPADRIRGRYSRLVIDLNRAADDVAAQLVPDHPRAKPRPSPGGGEQKHAIENRGVLWSHAVGRIPILKTLTYSAFEQRIDKFHRPYHRALEILLSERVQEFGYAILLDGHSMPSAVQQDLLLGTLDGTSCGPEIAQIAEQALSAPSKRVGTRLRFSSNAPYKGGEIVRNFGRPDRGVHALQLEVNRALYMDEYRLSLMPKPTWGTAGTPPRGHPKARGAELYRRIEALVRALSTPLNSLANKHSAPQPRSAEDA
jgi:N-formylglutamate amidohydrolase